MWYYYLNYKIYSFYRRKERNGIPAFYAFMVTVMLIYINIFSVWVMFAMQDEILKRNVAKGTVLIFMAIIGLVNYLLLYRRGKYKEVFDQFDKTFEQYKKWDLSVKLYIIGSVLFWLIMLFLMDRQNHLQRLKAP
ncbi:hypothetical protein [Taibaiella soli]|nr:hypothetical protein [Taibaiella soli]